MSAYDSRADLAPRDIVTRAIHNELLKHQIDHVYLDISHQPSHMIQSYFPTIYQFCYQNRIDPTKEPIPVVPAAHYTCGGVVTNLNAQTNIPHLYAIGEVACTGLHGANRMASNSLLECLVFSASASKAIQSNNTINSQISAPSPSMMAQANAMPTNPLGTQEAKVQSLIKQVRKLMWEKVGIVRNTEGLATAKAELEKNADGDARNRRHVNTNTDRISPPLKHCRTHHQQRTRPPRKLWAPLQRKLSEVAVA